MAITCNDPTALMAAANCYKCIPPGMQTEVMIYLLAAALNAQNGSSMDPAVLMRQAACMKCIPKGAQGDVLTYLMCTLLSVVGA